MLRGNHGNKMDAKFCTLTDTRRILVTVLGMVAEMERRFIVERQRAGPARTTPRPEGPQALFLAGWEREVAGCLARSLD
jgi:hypothetical protein